MGALLSKPEKTSAMQKKTTNPIGHRVQEQCKGFKHSVFSPESVALLCILIVGLILRGIYLGEIVKKPDFASPEVDARFHDYWARGLVWGNWAPPTNLLDPEISTSPYLRPPGYPYFLALIYKIAGPSYMTPRLVQMGLGLVSCVLAFILGRLWFGRCTGVIFAALMNIYWIFIYFEGKLLAPVLLIFLSLCLMLALSAWRAKFTYLRTVGAGILFGLSALVRPNILLFGPAVLAWAWWLKRRRRDKHPLKVAVMGFVLAAAAVIAPVTIRNYRAADDIVLITSNAGVNLYIGNNENTDCVWPSIPIVEELIGKRGWTCFDYPNIIRGVEQLQGKQMKHSEVSAYFSRKAIEFIRKNPAKALTLIGKRTLLFWGPAEISNNEVIECERKHSALLKYLPRFPTALSLCLVGIGLLYLDFRGEQKRKDKTDIQEKQLEASVLVILFIATYFVSYLPFFVAARFRLAIIPFLLLFASYALYRICQFIQQRNLIASICSILITIGLYTIAAKPFVPYEPDVALWHQQNADTYLRTGQTDRAIEEYLNSLRLKPDSYRTCQRLGSAFFLQKKYDKAIIHWIEAVRLKPNDHKTHALLGESFTKLGNIDNAIIHWTEALRLSPAQPALYYDLGLAFHKKGMIEKAIKHYKQALKLKPNYDKAKEKLTIALAQKKNQGDPSKIKKEPNLNDNSSKDQ
jgi:tetratricopeptide (TPR) repeat protein